MWPFTKKRPVTHGVRRAQAELDRAKIQQEAAQKTIQRATIIRQRNGLAEAVRVAMGGH